MTEPEFKRDFSLDKPGIVGARWWHQALVADQEKVDRRQVLVGLAGAGGCLAALAALGGIVSIASVVGGGAEATSLATRVGLEMQKLYGWDFGARGVPLVFDGKVEGPFVRAQLDQLAAVMTPSAKGPNVKHHVGTLLESLGARPAISLPDPGDGGPRPDAAPFQRVTDVLVPIVTPSMQTAYKVGEALARLAGTREGFAILVDLPGPDAVALAAGAASGFEAVLLLDNWPHPKAVVPSHLTLAALAYYQPRFAAHKERLSWKPLFVLDRGRLAAYSEESDRFDNRYYARVPRLDVLAKQGVTSLFYVVPDRSALPEPADLHPVLSARAGVEVRAIALTDFGTPAEGEPGTFYKSSSERDAGFWQEYSFAPSDQPEAETPKTPSSNDTKDYRFVARPAPAPPKDLGLVPVIVTASGVILSAALDRRGSMNRFAGGWSG